MVVSSESSDSDAESSPFVSKQELVKCVQATTKKEEKVHRREEEEDEEEHGNKKVKILETSYSSLANPKRKRKSSEGNMIAKPKTGAKKGKTSPQEGGKDHRDNDPGEPIEPSNSSSFRLRAMKMDLPIAPFKTPNKEPKVRPKAQEDKIETPKLPLPKSTKLGQQWLGVVETTQKHRRFSSDYNFSKYQKIDETIGHASNIWVKTTPFHKNKANHPQVIAIDCEMCETMDPVSSKKDHRALCRVSVVDAETKEVLLDSLVKPSWPVSDHRDWVNGITADDLAKVQFTLRHAQAFMMELCSEETVIVGHAVHNDLAALRMEHYCVADSASLYKAVDSETATVALRDVAMTILQRKMPQTHDSVNDAIVALACVDHFRKHKGDVEAIVRTPKPVMEGHDQSNNPKRSFARQLFVHRIPEKKCKESDLFTMFLEHTNIKPEEVDDIVFSHNGQGKTHIHFSSASHAELAFHTLQSKAEVEKSGRLQKNVYLRDGSYIRVRMMKSESQVVNNACN